MAVIPGVVLRLDAVLDHGFVPDLLLDDRFRLRRVLDRGLGLRSGPGGSLCLDGGLLCRVRAEAEGADLLMIDTAGRLQNRQDLMEELAKIVRVIRKKDPTAPHNTLLVLDATTGQNAPEPGGNLPPVGRRVRAGDDEAGRHGARRSAGGLG